MAERDDDLSLPGLGSIHLIRRGDSSSLFRGRQLRFNRDVAVKLFPGRMDGPRRERFEKECAAMGALSAHPHVVTFFDSGVDRAGGYIVGEWLAGGSYAERLARGSLLDWSEAVTTGIKLAGALESAHRAGVLHDNLKPQNVFLSSFGDPVLGDFALGAADATRSSDAYDTAVHAAPERLAGGGPSASSDVYALASVIVTLALGHSPYATSVEEPLVRVAARKAGEAPADLRPQGASDAVCRVLEAALAPDPAHRPAGAARLGRALQAAQQAAGETVTRMVVFPETEDDQAELAPPAVPSAAPASAAPAAPAPVVVGTARALPDQVRAVLGVAVDRYRGRDVGARLAALRVQLREPARVLVVGAQGVGKSTLVNGIIGDDVAPTGGTAANGITCWYSSGATYTATARLRSGEERPVPLSRRGRGVEIDLAGLDPALIDHITVAWPSPSLAALTLVDGPDLSTGKVSADALVYVTSAWTDDDLRAIERAQSALPSATASLTTIVVLAPRDDGTGSGPDPLAAAQAQADILRRAPEVRRRVQDVIAVLPVLGAAASTFGADDLLALLRLVGPSHPGGESGPGDAIVARLGLSGGRRALDLVRGGVATVSQLAGELVECSGLQALRDVLSGVVVPRCEIVRAGAALDAVAATLRREPVAGSEKLAFDLERVGAAAHELAELRVLVALRGGRARLRPDDAAAADRLLGGTNPAPGARLGLPPDTGPDEMARALGDAVARWRRLAASPVTARPGMAVARAVTRSAEGMAVAVAGAR